MDGCADHTPSPSGPSEEPTEPRASQATLLEDVDMSSGSSGNETSENGSTGRDSRHSGCGDSGREPGLLLLPVFPGSRGETRSSAVGQTASSSSGQVQQAHVQLPGGESLASPGATPAPFGKTPRAVFCLCFPA